MSSLAYHRNWRRNRINNGICPCGGILVKGKPVCNDCKQLRNSREALEMAERKECGLCRTIGCPNDRRTNRSTCVVCADKSAKSSKKQKAKRKAVGKCVTSWCKNDSRPNKALCSDCCKIQSEAGYKLKQIVLDYYGQVCSCLCGCRVTKFAWLTIDHKDNDGAEKRREGIHAIGSKFYRQIIREGFPDSLQILCWNCNCAKGKYGGCG